MPTDCADDDRPGMVGLVGTTRSAAGISMEGMAVGPDPRDKTLS